MQISRFAESVPLGESLKTLRPQNQISAELLRVGKVATYLLLFLAPFVPRWVLVYHHVANLMPEFSSTLFYLVDIPLILAVVLWLMAHLLDASHPVRFDPWFITIPLLILTTLSGLSVLWATSKSISAETFIRLCAMLALYLLIHNELTNCRVAAWVLSIGMVVQSVVATAQFYLQRPVGFSFLGETEALITLPGLWVRGYGFSPNPNILGGYLAMGLAATLALALNAIGRRERIVLLLIFGVGVSGLLSTFSRSAWVGIALGMGLLTAVILSNPVAHARWGSTFLLLGLVGISVCLIYVASTPDFFVSRLVAPVAGKLGLYRSPLEHPEMFNLHMRRGYSRVAWHLIVNHFPWGVGSANFSLASYLLEPDLPREHVFLPVHNVPLLLTAELGPVGGLSWIFLLVTFAFGLWHKRTALAQDPWFLGWSVATLSLLATGFFDFYIWGWQCGRVMLWTTAGLWAGAYSRETKR